MSETLSVGPPDPDTDAVIQVVDLTKVYGAHTAVDRVSFAARPGAVTAFLGPNGAGKSTTLRMLVGLTPPTSGRALVAGRPYRALPNPGRRVGVLLDASAQHAGRTGRETLTLSAMVMGVDRARVDEMLALVGLTAAEAGRRIRTYSLGMRQRLGLAHALLGDPQVLILDEPLNGLDPAGIHWMRGLLREFADRGGAVLLSSHLLREVEAVADDLIVIGRGRVVTQGPLQGLLEAAGTFVRGTDGAALATALDRAGIPVTPGAGGGYLARAATERIATVAAQAGVVIVELRPTGGAGLEDVFLQLTAEDSREDVAR